MAQTQTTSTSSLQRKPLAQASVEAHVCRHDLGLLPPAGDTTDYRHKQGRPEPNPKRRKKSPKPGVKCESCAMLKEAMQTDEDALKVAEEELKQALSTCLGM